MRELKQAVLKHLEGQKDSAGAIALWEKLCVAFEKGGSPGAAKLLDKLAVLPPTDHDAGDGDGDDEEGGD